MITLVSGLPRSGTSLMMQMLHAGGMPVLTDNLRTPDANNPQGFLEYEKVKALKKDNTWLREADGRVVKIVSHLLQYLDASLQYEVIFMVRDVTRDDAAGAPSPLRSAQPSSRWGCSSRPSSGSPSGSVSAGPSSG